MCKLDNFWTYIQLEKYSTGYDPIKIKFIMLNMLLFDRTGSSMDSDMTNTIGSSR